MYRTRFSLYVLTDPERSTDGVSPLARGYYMKMSARESRGTLGQR